MFSCKFNCQVGSECDGEALGLNGLHFYEWLQVRLWCFTELDWSGATRVDQSARWYASKIISIDDSFIHSLRLTWKVNLVPGTNWSRTIQLSPDLSRDCNHQLSVRDFIDLSKPSLSAWSGAWQWLYGIMHEIDGTVTYAKLIFRISFLALFSFTQWTSELSNGGGH